MLKAILLLIGGLILVIYFSEQLVKGLVGTARAFHVSAFLLSVIFIGFDPENLGVGALGNFEGAEGIAAGSIIGAGMVAVALALGITAMVTPLRFQAIPKQILIIPLLAVLLFTILIADQKLSRIDGFLLLTAYCLTILFLIKLNRKGINVEAGGEVAESLEKDKLPGKWSSVGLFLISLLAIIGGSEMVINGSKGLLETLHFSETFYGMTILAFLVSIEEIARELPPALKGKPDISLGNVIGSFIAFFLFNAGIIGIVAPLDLSASILQFFLPVAILSIAFITILLLIAKQIPRWGGLVLVLFYLVFIAGGYWIE